MGGCWYLCVLRLMIVRFGASVVPVPDAGIFVAVEPVDAAMLCSVGVLLCWL